MNRQSITILTFAALVLVASFFWFQADGVEEVQNGSVETLTDPVLLEGKRLSEIHCSSCHRYPDPGLLPWHTWRFQTLGAMAPFLGVEDPNSSGQPYDPSRNPYLPKNFYPSEPQVSQDEWQKIKDYYLAAAPRELNSRPREPSIIVDSLFFRARRPAYKPGSSSAVTAIAFDPGNRLIYLGDSGELKFMVFDHRLELVHSFDIESPLSQIRMLNDKTKPGRRELLLTFIGHLQPSDAPYGSIARGWYDPELRSSGIDTVLSDRIARPVESKFADLNGDQMDDLLVNEFGHRAGSLFWLEYRGEGVQSKKRLLIDSPGCIQSYVIDFSDDDLSDVVALCSQTDQAVYLFTNLGNGEFERKTLLRFEVTAGSSSFELHDFNGDKNPDILYTSGDNADFSQTFKPYHGVYIYLNDGDNRFTESWFYPVNGAYNAKARDFTGDGLTDLAVISYFADYEHSPEEGFLFFKNEGDLTFTPYHHPGATNGRWITLDVADWTGDQAYDIILANYSEGPLGAADHLKGRWIEEPYFLVLENRNDQGQ